jgi:pimeloyl-ACP methyl ester carboxylesterase
MVHPETKYARSGDVHIAYQVVGEGPLDLVYVRGWVSNLDYAWEEPSYARFINRLASFSRVILFDKRGTGLSDRVSESALPTLEQRMDDVRAVMDAVHSERAALVGVSEGGPMCALFAATYPKRTLALVMYGAYARRMWDVDYPWGTTEEQLETFLEEIERGWGGPVGLARRAPSAVNDERFSQWWASYLRASASPQAVLALVRMNAHVDIRHILPSIRVPTLVIHRQGDLAVNVEQGRHMARAIPDAKYVELPGVDHLPWIGDQDAILDEIEEFLTGVRPCPESNRVLATVLFTDIVGSTEQVARLGDRAWRNLLERHHALVRKELTRFRGSEVDTAGDGFFATFDGPARAIRCGLSIRDGMRQLGIEIRAGLHTGEIELTGDKVGGIAVHTGARVAAAARSGEVLVSSTVKDLVAGSGIHFTDRGTHALKGVPGEWRLFVVTT